jgi:hypothetical protein
MPTQITPDQMPLAQAPTLPAPAPPASRLPLSWLGAIIVGCGLLVLAAILYSLWPRQRLDDNRPGQWPRGDALGDYLPEDCAGVVVCRPQSLLALPPVKKHLRGLDGLFELTAPRLPGPDEASKWELVRLVFHAQDADRPVLLVRGALDLTPFQAHLGTPHDGLYEYPVPPGNSVWHLAPAPPFLIGSLSPDHAGAAAEFVGHPAEKPLRNERMRAMVRRANPRHELAFAFDVEALGPVPSFPDPLTDRSWTRIKAGLATAEGHIRADGKALVFSARLEAKDEQAAEEMIKDVKALLRDAADHEALNPKMSSTLVPFMELICRGKAVQEGNTITINGRVPRGPAPRDGGLVPSPAP